HTRFSRDWSSDVCSSDLTLVRVPAAEDEQHVLQAVSVGGDSDDVGGQADRLVRHAVSPVSRCGGGGGSSVWRPCCPLTVRAGARTRRLPALRVLRSRARYPRSASPR